MAEQAWDRMEGEPNLWYQRFERYRLLGPTRSIDAAWRAEAQQNAAKRRKASRVSSTWRTRAAEWQWHTRAAAWDKYLSDQAEAAIEERWRASIMGPTEVLGRIGDLARSAASETARIQALSMAGKSQRVFDPPDAASVASAPFELPASCLAPRFLDAYDDIRDHNNTEYVFSGGRGSTKSSFISLALVYLLKHNPDMHAIALRQVANTLRDSVYSQIVWAISELGLDSEFKTTTSPLEITYLPTGQKIYFRGADEPGKIKSIKPAFGYIGTAWFEELDQFHGPEAVRNIEQSAIRGGDLAYIFKSFNPPRTAANWVNKYVQIPKANQYLHHSTYLELGSRIRWLGRPWVEEAEHLKTVNPTAYEHEYLGIANGTGGMVFDNVQLREIAAGEIEQFDRVLHGVDWGYFPDPWAWNKCHYDAARMTLYIFDELRVFRAGNQETADKLRERGVGPDDLIIADSAEPKSVADYRAHDLAARGAEKGPESVKYSMKWLQSLAAIVIDPARCPHTAEEFINYELEMDNNGEFISEYPDRDNHHIDAVRYATNLIWKRRGQ